MRLLIAFTAFNLLAHSMALAQTCPMLLAAPVITSNRPLTAAPVIHTPRTPTAAPIISPHPGCDVEPGGGPANCPAQNVSWKVVLVTYTAPLAALNHGQTGRATYTFLGTSCSADFICNNGTVSQTAAGFCL